MVINPAKFKVTLGVPQESVLELLLFNLLANDIILRLNFSERLRFAEDFKPSTVATAIEDCCRLQLDIENWSIKIRCFSI